MSQQRIIVTTVPASVTAETEHASGQLLAYDMVIGVALGRLSAKFQHPSYEQHVDRRAKPKHEEIMMPTLMAARFFEFVQACFVARRYEYDGGDFTTYLYGLQATPAHSSTGSLRLATEWVSGVSRLDYHVIGTESGKIIQTFIGLSNQRALAVLGGQGVLGIMPATDLMRVYGGIALGSLVHVSR